MGLAATARRILTPRYVPLWLADVAYVVLYWLTAQSVTIEPGQGALKRVYVFPLFHGTYRSSDVVGSATATDPGWLLANLLVGLIVLYLPINAAVNLTGPGPLRDWVPWKEDLAVFLLMVPILIFAFFMAVMAGHGALTLWYLLSITTLLSIVAVVSNSMRPEHEGVATN